LEEEFMGQFQNVAVIRKANVYFDGKVTSRTILFADGSRKTLGIMLPGDYEFGTDAAEVMEILAGKIDVLLPGQTEWHTYTGGDSFQVPANSRFKLQVKTVVDYCCSYEEK
jgi:purine/pyrimidine-nucleoside phosphorylase